MTQAGDQSFCDVLSDTEVATVQAQHHPSRHYADLCDNDGDDWPCWVARALARIERDRELLGRCAERALDHVISCRRCYSTSNLRREGRDENCPYCLPDRQLLADLRAAGVDQ